MSRQFTDRDRAMAATIVHVFETSKIKPDFDEVAVFHDGPGGIRQLTFGSHQFTDASGSLDRVVEKIISLCEISYNDAPWIKVLKNRLPTLKKGTTSSIQAIAGDMEFRMALIESAKTPEGQQAQLQVYDELYVQPAVLACAGSGWESALSLTTVLDSMTHGGWRMIRDQIANNLTEKQWIASYLLRRSNWLTNHPKQILKKTACRPNSLLELASGNQRLPLVEAIREARWDDAEKLMAQGNWDLTSPVSLDMKSRGKFTIEEKDLNL